MKEFIVLNYPGSKRRLLDFIHSSLENHINENDVILDIFSGTSSVGYSFKKNHKILANDTEVYCTNISKAVLRKDKLYFNRVKKKFLELYELNHSKLEEIKRDELSKEKEFIDKKDYEQLSSFVWSCQTLFNSDSISFGNYGELTFKNVNQKLSKSLFSLFTLYYSNSYFGLKQSIEIDSLRYAIEFMDNKECYFTSLYFAMKEAVFSKDGHMAQPLNPFKHPKRLLKSRSVSILEKFLLKLNQFDADDFVLSEIDNEVFNLNFLDLMSSNEIISQVDVIYADPPYTDMQYSRYFHLLTTLTNYKYDEPTIRFGKYTSGLYLNNRYQSNLSKRKFAINEMIKLVDYSAKNRKVLAISYGYPIDKVSQKTDRYTFDVDIFIEKMKNFYDNVTVYKQLFKHANNRNSKSKRVFEYVIVGSMR